MKTPDGISVTVKITNTGASVVANAKLYVVLYEDLGTDEHHYTVRDILTPLTLGSLAPGATQQLSASSTYSGSTAKLNAVVYLKSSTGEILQAALATIG